MINNADNLYNSYYYSPQLLNLWDFYIEDWSRTSGISKFRVVESSLPASIKLSVSSFETGEKYYSGFEYPESFNLVVREDTNFSSYTYFKNWLKSVINIDTGEFISSRTPKTKNATLIFYKYSLNEEYTKLSSTIKNRLLSIHNNITDTLIEKATRAVQSNIPGGALGAIAGLGISRTVPDISSEINKALSREKQYHSEVETKVFEYHNLRILGISEIPLSYTNTDEMTITVSLSVDRITEGTI
jgi:hypothetical protein